jgi:hypothetical protein
MPLLIQACKHATILAFPRASCGNWLSQIEEYWLHANSIRGNLLCMPQGLYSISQDMEVKKTHRRRRLFWDRVETMVVSYCVTVNSRYESVMS